MDPARTDSCNELITDPGLLAEAMHGADLRPCQLSKQPIASELRRVLFSSSCLDLIRLGPAMLFTGATPAECYTLMYILECPEAGHSFNFSIDHYADYIALFPPGECLDSKTPRGYNVGIFTVEADNFLSMVERLYPDIPDSFFSRSAAMRVERTASTELRRLIELVRKHTGNSYDSLEDRVARRLMEDQLLEAFLGVLNEGRTHLEPPPGNRTLKREQKFRKIRDYLAERIHQPVGLPEICVEVGLSARAVEELFHDYLGIGPHLYFRHQRLHAAREALSACRSIESGIIKKIALDHGFWHLGRFSGYYKELFAEKPSDTLARGVEAETAEWHEGDRA